MAKAIPLPSLDRLHELFKLDADAGVLIARITRNKRIAGTVVGTPTDEGRFICRVDYKIYYVHRIIWKMVHGSDPVDFIDHHNRRTGANGIGNLRSATHAQNSQNRGANRNTKSGLKGAHWSSSEQKWRSSIKVVAAKKYFGAFAGGLL